MNALIEYYQQVFDWYDKNSIYLKCILFKYSDKYYPIKTILLPVLKNSQYKPNSLEIVNYKDFLFMNGILTDANNLFESFKNNFIYNKLSFLLFSANTNIEILDIFQNIPELQAYKRNIEESDDALNKVGFYSPLIPQEISIIKESCSYPLLKLKEYPGYSYLYYLKIDNEIRNAFNKKLRNSEPLIPLDKAYPLFPDYHSAAKYYFKKEHLLLND
jgi:hypothetical protein